MSAEIQQLQASITALEAQRHTLGDVVVDSLLGPARTRLAELSSIRKAEPHQTIKQATILFMDVVGSTPLSQQLDPEEFHTIVDSVLVRGTVEVQNRGGKIISYAGDNLIAVFGGVAAREDAAENAVNAGLAIIEIGRSLHDQVLERFNLDGSNVRVGIHTGTVLLGGGVQADNTISGMNVNIAARMEQTAPPGALRISNTTCAMVRGVFDVEPQPPIEVKGLSEPMITYLVRRAKPRAFRVASRGIEGVETKMVARDAELGALQKSFELLLTKRRLSIVTVVGDAGVGKSRLLYEFENWADGRPESFTFFQGRANPQTVSQPYGLLRDILARRFQIADDTPMQDAKERLIAGVSPLFADDGPGMEHSHAHLLGQLIGLDFSDSPHVAGILEDAKQIRNRGFHAVTQMFRRIALTTGNPIVLQLEDLHWADSGSLDFVLQLGKVNGDVPIMVIGLTRDTLFERRKDWFPSDGARQRIDLHPLDQSASAMLAGELLKKLPEVPASLLDLINVRSEGNPFYMEELVKMLIDQGAIQIGITEDETWRVNPEKLGATTIPPTLVGVLQTRLDSLPAAERLAMQQSSVIGLVFWDKALEALDANSIQVLPTLVERDLTRLQPDGRTEGLREYIFKHQILHQVTYDTLLTRHRKELHAKAADWLAHRSGSRSKDFLGVAAQHYEQTDDFVHAVEFYAQAAEHALTGFAHELALGYAQSAINLLGKSKTEQPGIFVDVAGVQWRLLDVQDKSFSRQGKHEPRLPILDSLEEIAEALNDDRSRADVFLRRANVAKDMGKVNDQASFARKTTKYARLAGNEELRFKGCGVLALALIEQGKFRQASRLLGVGLKKVRHIGFRRLEGMFLNATGFLYERSGEIGSLLSIFQQSSEIAQEVGDRGHEAVAMNNVGVTWSTLGKFELAKECLSDALDLCRTIGGHHLQAHIFANLAGVSLNLGSKDTAILYANEALNLAQALRAPPLVALSNYWIGVVLLSLAEFEQALTAFSEAKTIAKSIGLPWQHDATAGCARTELAQGKIHKAFAHAQILIAHLDAGGSFDGTENASLILLTCYRVLLKAGDPRAHELLSHAHTELHSKANGIADPDLRISFMTNVPEHREVIKAWNRKGNSRAILK
jgi:class 3 adenylate cyclase/tetratricopeptide (TPR) repeat protein